MRGILRAKVQLPDGRLIANEAGVPQGGSLSPLLSNIVLDELDWELARRGHRFVRYADDTCVFVRSARAGRRVMASLGRFLQGRMRLSLNARKSRLTCPEATHFLGFRFVVAADGSVAVHLSAKAKQRLDARIREVTPRNWGQFRLCTGEGVWLFARFDAHIRRRLRMLAVRQKKRPRFLVRHLVAKGVRVRTAKLAAYSGRGLWYRSNHAGVTRAYPNAWFHQRLVSLVTRWQDLNPPPTASRQLRLEV